MNYSQAKKIPIDQFLEQLGHLPKYVRGSDLWYHSPFRNENTPSFKVNVQINAWYDFGEGKGGTILDLVMRLYGIGNAAEASKQLGEIYANGANANATQKLRPNSKPENKPAAIVTKVLPIRSSSLISYLQKRGISKDLADKNGVKEIHYQVGEKEYFAIGLENDSPGSFEVRNPYFKGTVGKKDLCTIDGSSTVVNLFEGFIDYLTALEVSQNKPEGTTIILNSAALLERAISKISKLSPSEIRFYRDRDTTGERLLGDLKNARPDTNILDMSCQWNGHKDLNEWFVSKNCKPESMVR